MQEPRRGHGKVLVSALRFRNLDVSPEDPVQTWPFEGILAAIERGTLPDWQRLTATIDTDPWGPVARQVEQALTISRPFGAAPLMETVIETARARAAESERQAVAAEIRTLVHASGLSQQAFAASTGTSASRLSTYLSGRVAPSAPLLLRMRQVAQKAADTHTTPRTAR
jgi:DNA-binding transcriptional regulator YiaG